MIELRDGEFAVWCRCRRRFAVPSLAAALASGHHCGGGPKPAVGGVGRAAALQPEGGGLSQATARKDNDVGGRESNLNRQVVNLVRAETRPLPPITVPRADRQPGRNNPAVPSVNQTGTCTTTGPVLARTRGDVKSS
jgi:hypothetical protein